MNNEEEKLKPVVFIKGRYDFHRQNLFQQNLLLKALQITTDPQKLKEMVGLKTVSEVYRTLDKLAIRKEYHEALIRQGIDLDAIIGGIKKVCDTGENGLTRLAAWKTLLKSVGLDEYKETSEDSKKTWEEIVRDISEKESTKDVAKIAPVKYEVNVPQIPEGEGERLAEEEEMGKSLYKK